MQRVGEVVGRVFLENGGVGYCGHAEDPITAAIPVGDSDVFDDALFEETDGLQGRAVVVEKFEEFFGALARESYGVGQQLALLLNR